jgi:hypothetical protein
MRKRTGDEYVDMHDVDWLAMIGAEMNLPVCGEHYLGLAQRPDAKIIPDGMLEMIREPERTKFRRMRDGEFPFSTEDIQAMDPPLRKSIVICHNAWQDCKGSPNGVSSYAQRARTAALTGAVAEEFYWQDKAED